MIHPLILFSRRAVWNNNKDGTPFIFDILRWHEPRPLVLRCVYSSMITRWKRDPPLIAHNKVCGLSEVGVPGLLENRHCQGGFSTKRFVVQEPKSSSGRQLTSKTQNNLDV